MSVVPSVEGGACDTMKQHPVMAGVGGVPEHEPAVGCRTRDRDIGLGRGSCVTVQWSPHPTGEGWGSAWKVQEHLPGEQGGGPCRLGMQSWET